MTEQHDMTTNQLSLPRQTETKQKSKKQNWNIFVLWGF